MAFALYSPSAGTASCAIAVATAATNMVGQEGDLFRFTLKHSIAMLMFICFLTLAQAYVLKWMLP